MPLVDPRLAAANGADRSDSAADDGGGLSAGAKLAIGGGVAAAALGVGALVLLRRGGGGGDSRVIGVIEGVELLSNPRLPRGANASWNNPQGAVFGGANGRVSIEHVDQGALGDCWNIAGMGAIAHRRPDVFESMVREVGDHVIVNLPERPVALTRELPINRSGSPAFAGTNDAADAVHWPAYVEKAQAAVGGGYASLEGGFTKETFRQLLGSNPQRVASRGSILDDVLHHLDSRTPVAISTQADETASSATKARMEQLNVFGNHYYVPIERTTVDGEDAVRLFNPWGKDHPTEPIRRSDLQQIFDGVDTPDEYVRFGTRG